MKKQLLFKRNQKGITLIEALLVLGLGIAIIAYGLISYGGAQDKNKLGEESRNISLLKSNIEDRYRSSSTSEEGLDNVIAVQGGLIPKNIKSKPDGTIVNGFGGSVLVGVSGTDGYFIEYAKIPSSICTALVTNFQKEFSSIVIGGTTIQPTSTQSVITPACSATPELVVRFITDQA